MFSHGYVNDVNAHNRNLKNDQIIALKEKRGVMGLSFVGEFVGNRTIDGWLHHFRKGMEITEGKNIFAMGSDFDGMFDIHLIAEIDNVEKLEVVETAIVKNFGKAIAEDFFYNNARKLISNRENLDK